MAGSRHYSAFISYRHLEPDAYVAERLQRMLESYRPPKGAGVKDRIEYVFLDRAELPTSKSLDQSLKDALHNSDYLIVILSEKYKESIWCMEEIRVFKEIHGGRVDRILPVLVQGEPADALPGEICFEEYAETGPDGTERVVRKELEPLCCDVRGNSRKEIDRKLKVEFLRLAAPMLGCGFDDLYQRHRRREKQRQAVLTGSAFALLTAILAVVLASYHKVSVSQRQYRQSLLTSYTLTGTERSGEQDGREAMAYYAKVLKDDRMNGDARTGALLELQKQAWIVREEEGEAVPAAGEEQTCTIDIDENTITVRMADGASYVMPRPTGVSSDLKARSSYGSGEDSLPAVAPVAGEGGTRFAVYFGGYLYLYEPLGGAGGGGAIECAAARTADLGTLFAENYSIYNYRYDANLYVSPSGTRLALRSDNAFAMVDIASWTILHVRDVGPFTWKALLFSPQEDRYAVCRLASTDFGNNGPIVEIFGMDGAKWGTSEKDTKYDFVGAGFSRDGNRILWARTNRISLLSGTNADRVSAELVTDRPVTKVTMQEDGSFTAEFAGGEVKRYRVVSFVPAADTAQVSFEESEDNAYRNIDEAERKQLEETLGRQILFKAPYPGGSAVAATGGTVFLFRDGETEPFRAIETEHSGMIFQITADGQSMLVIGIMEEDGDEFLEIWDYDQGLHFTNLKEDYLGREIKIGEDGTLYYRRNAPAYGVDEIRALRLAAPEPDEAAVRLLESLTSGGLDDSLRMEIKDPAYDSDMGNWKDLMEEING